MNLTAIFGIIATVSSAVGLVPQVYRSLRTRQLGDVSLPTYSLLMTAFTLWLLYGILTNDFILTFSTSINLIAGAIILALKVKYG